MLKLKKIFKMPSIKSEKKLSECDLIETVEDFQLAIKCERARANRNNQIFTLVVFDAQKQNGNLKKLRLFVNFLSSRIRLTDNLGWFDEKSIGILLPNTTREGAGKFVLEIKSRLDQNVEFPEFTIYEYPSIRVSQAFP